MYVCVCMYVCACVCVDIMQVVSRGNDQVAITSKFEARADTG